MRWPKFLATVGEGKLWMLGLGPLQVEWLAQAILYADEMGWDALWRQLSCGERIRNLLRRLEKGQPLG